MPDRELESLAATVEAAAAEAGVDLATLLSEPTRSVPPPTLTPRPDLLQEVRLQAAPVLEVHDAIGEGGMGVVRRATQTRLAREVAVKSVRPELGGRDTHTLRLLREAWVTGALEHPNIVPVHDLEVDEAGNVSIVLKRIEGRPWSDLLHDPEAIGALSGGETPLAWNLGVIVAVTHAIRFAHARGIVHRDLKPENVMVGDYGEVYVLDWGIAVSTDDDLGGRFPRAAEADGLAGTPAYMAPEMLGGRGAELGPATDVYLLGAILHEIATGAPPHQGPNLMAMVSSVVVSEPSLDGVPDELAAIISRAMQAEPADRYPDVESLADAVRAFLSHEGSRSIAADALERLVELEAELTQPTPDPARVARLHAACSFGFRHALEGWSDNAPARQGLRSATIAMAEFDLGRDMPSAAAGHLAQIDDPPTELLARIETRSAALAAERRALLQRAGELDASRGRGFRLLLAGGVALFFTLAPAYSSYSVGWGVRADQTYAAGFGVAGLVVLGFALLFRRSVLLGTRVNRMVSVGLFVVFTAQAALNIGDALAGIDALTTLRHQFLLYAVGVGMTTALYGRLMYVPAAGFLVAYCSTMVMPGLVHVAMSACNGLLAIVLLRLWLRPRATAGGPPEGDGG